jgi:hypothetical protein
MPVTDLTNPDVRAAVEGIYKILPTGLLNAPGVYFLLHRPTKRAYVGVVKSISLHAAYLRGQFARCAKGLLPTVKLANMPSFNNQWDDWAFRAIPLGSPADAGSARSSSDAELLRKTLESKGVRVVNTRSRVRGPNKPRDQEMPH